MAMPGRRPTSVDYMQTWGTLKQRQYEWVIEMRRRWHLISNPCFYSEPRMHFVDAGVEQRLCWHRMKMWSALGNKRGYRGIGCGGLIWFERKF